YFFSDPSLTNIYTLSLHDALPILPLASLAGFGDTGAAFRPRDPRREADDTLAQSKAAAPLRGRRVQIPGARLEQTGACDQVLVLDRKSTRLNSSHRTISYAVFCLK